MPAASAARAIKPRWRLLAKLCTCSTQIPVKLATSESVKIFWLDFTVTMARLLCSATYLAHTCLDAESIVCAARFLSNSRSVLPSKNELSSTFSLKPAITALFHTFSYCGGCSTGLTIGGNSGKNILLFQTCYGFR